MTLLNEAKNIKNSTILMQLTKLLSRKQAEMISPYKISKSSRKAAPMKSSPTLMSQNANSFHTLINNVQTKCFGKNPKKIKPNEEPVSSSVFALFPFLTSLPVHQIH